VPKAEELVATPYRHGSKEKAETFFLDGMTQAMHRLAEQAHPAFPVTIYYAFKQAESDGADGTTNTGWDTFLAAVIRSRLRHQRHLADAHRTEQPHDRLGHQRPRLQHRPRLPPATRQRTHRHPPRVRHRPQGRTARKRLAHLQRGNIAPVDLAQAAIGPGMAVYTRYAKVLDAEGKPLPVRAALALINQTLDEALAEQEGDFDADSRWALTWFDQTGFAEGDYGVAEQLSKSKNTSVGGLDEAGILVSRAGKVRLLETRRTARRLGSADRQAAHALGDRAPPDPRAGIRRRERRRRAGRQARQQGGNRPRTLLPSLHPVRTQEARVEAMAYNGLVQSWPEITRLAAEKPRAVAPGTPDLFGQE
jgi:putative DNA methylase